MKIERPTCNHEDTDPSCLACIIEDEQPDQIEILPDGTLKFTLLYETWPTGQKDGCPTIQMWKFNGLRWEKRNA